MKTTGVVLIWVIITGLFSYHHGNKKNLPIVRTGTIAMIPDEMILTEKFGNMEGYLIECRSISGISGSPVFVLKPTSIELNGHQVLTSRVSLYLLGLIHGHWDNSYMM